MEELLKRQYPLQTSSRPYTFQLNSEGEGCICREPGLGAEGWWKGWLGPSGSYMLLLASLVQQPCAMLSKFTAHNIMVLCFFENSEKLLAQKQCSFLDIIIRESSALEKIYLLLFFFSFATHDQRIRVPRLGSPTSLPCSMFLVGYSTSEP